MPNRTNVYRRGAVYYLRLRIPADLQPIFKIRELRRSLGVSDHSRAKVAGALAAARAMDLFRTLRLDPMLPADHQQKLLTDLYDTILRIDLELRSSREPCCNHHCSLPPLRRRLDLDPADLSSRLARGDMSAAEPWATRICEEANLSVEKGSRDFRELAFATMRTLLEGAHRIAERDRGIYFGRPADPLLGGSGMPQARSEQQLPGNAAPSGRFTPHVASPARLCDDANLPLSVLVHRMHAARSGLADATKREHVVAVEMFEDHLGGAKPIGSITRKDVVNYKARLLETPTNRTQRFPGLSIEGAIAANRHRNARIACGELTGAKPYDVLSATTINDKWLSHLKAVFTWATEELVIPENPASGVVVKDKGGRRSGRLGKKRFPFSPDQLARIMATPPFNGEGPKDEKLYAPLFALYGGSRVTEAGQMEVPDIRKIDGVWCAAITTQSDGDEDEDDPEKRLKNDGSERIVPIHRMLIAIGFLDWVDTQRRNGERRVFPGWKPDRNGSYVSTLPRWFNRTLLPRAGVKTKQNCFYSFRHTFKDAARHSGMDKEARDYVQGHKAGDVASLYGLGFSVSRLAEMVNAITYAGIDLKHLYVANGASDD